MTTWHVDLQYDRNLGHADDDLIDRFNNAEEQLADYAAAVGQHNGALSVDLAIDAPTYRDAIERAEEAVEQAIQASDLHSAGQVESVTVTEWERFEREQDTPNYPDIVSTVEAADILGVSRQRVHQLWKENPQFPTPLYELRTGPLWVRAGIEKFNQCWERKPGRPSNREQKQAIREWGAKQGKRRAGAGV